LGGAVGWIVDRTVAEQSCTEQDENADDDDPRFGRHIRINLMAASAISARVSRGDYNGSLYRKQALAARQL
jgi:hypothetical protein